MSIPFLFGRLIVVADMSQTKTLKLSHLKQESSGEICQVADMIRHLNGCLAINIACDVLCTSFIFSIPLPWTRCPFQAATRQREVRSAGCSGRNCCQLCSLAKGWREELAHFTLVMCSTKYSQIQVWQKLSRFDRDFSCFSDFKVWCYCLGSDRAQSKS